MSGVAPPASGTTAGTPASGPAVDALNAVTAWVEDGLRYVTQHAGEVLAQPGPNRSAAVLELGGTLRWLALASVVATAMLSAAGALVARRGELSGVVREVPLTLVMLAGWYLAVGSWAALCSGLADAIAPSDLLRSLQSGVTLDPEIAPFVRVVLCVLMMVCLVVLLVEMFVLQHLMTFAVLLGPLALSVRPWPALREVSSKMIRNLAALSLTPPLTLASTGLALRGTDTGGPWAIGTAIAGLAGLTVAAITPIALTKLLPLGAGSRTVRVVAADTSSAGSMSGVDTLRAGSGGTSDSGAGGA